MAVWNVIDHEELTGTTAYWEKTSISQSYEHLYLVASVRCDEAAYLDTSYIQLNGETSHKYSSIALTDDGSPNLQSNAQITGSNTWQQAWVDLRFTANTATANTFGVVTMLIPNYTNTSNKKQVLMTSVAENKNTGNGAWGLRMLAGLFHSTSAITSVKLRPYGGLNDWMQYSTFTLYGVSA